MAISEVSTESVARVPKRTFARINIKTRYFSPSSMPQRSDFNTRITGKNPHECILLDYLCFVRALDLLFIYLIGRKKCCISTESSGTKEMYICTRVSVKSKK